MFGDEAFMLTLFWKAKTQPKPTLLQIILESIIAPFAFPLAAALTRAIISLSAN